MRSGGRSGACGGCPEGEAASEVARLLEVVKLPADLGGRKPDRLSGGQKQRVAIARALAGNPDVIVADEPVSALDVSVQASIINLLNEIQAAREATLVFISHDLVGRALPRRSRRGDVSGRRRRARLRSADVFAPPYHPYTEALLSAVPVPDPDAQGARIVLEGPLPSADGDPARLPVQRRAAHAGSAPICDETPPPTRQISSGHRIVCHIPAEELARLQAAGFSPPPPTR